MRPHLAARAGPVTAVLIASLPGLTACPAGERRGSQKRWHLRDVVRLLLGGRLTFDRMRWRPADGQPGTGFMHFGKETHT